MFNHIPWIKIQPDFSPGAWLRLRILNANSSDGEKNVYFLRSVAEELGGRGGGEASPLQTSADTFPVGSEWLLKLSHSQAVWSGSHWLTRVSWPREGRKVTLDKEWILPHTVPIISLEEYSHFLLFRSHVCFLQLTLSCLLVGLYLFSYVSPALSKGALSEWTNEQVNSVVIGWVRVKWCLSSRT